MAPTPISPRIGGTWLILVDEAGHSRYGAVEGVGPGCADAGDETYAALGLADVVSDVRWRLRSGGGGLRVVVRNSHGSLLLVIFGLHHRGLMASKRSPVRRGEALPAQRGELGATLRGNRFSACAARQGFHIAITKAGWYNVKWNHLTGLSD